MRNNKRQVILDFTSLLDVIMLILFFFVIFAQLDSDKAIESAEERMAEADRMISEAESAYEQAEQKMDELRKDEALAKAVLLNNNGDFGRAVQLQLELGRSENADWDITVTAAGADAAYIINDVRNREPSELAAELDGIISLYSYSPSDAVLINLVYDSEAAGSRRSKSNSDDMLRIMREEYGYTYLFSTTVDICGKDGG